MGKAPRKLRWQIRRPLNWCRVFVFCAAWMHYVIPCNGGLSAHLRPRHLWQSMPYGLHEQTANILWLTHAFVLKQQLVFYRFCWNSNMMTWSARLITTCRPNLIINSIEQGPIRNHVSHSAKRMWEFEAFWNEEKVTSDNHPMAIESNMICTLYCRLVWSFRPLSSEFSRRAFLILTWGREEGCQRDGEDGRRRRGPRMRRQRWHLERAPQFRLVSVIHSL